MTQPADHHLPGELQVILDDLRNRIRRYVLIEGASLVVAVLCGLFWLSFFTDWAYFRLSRLELPAWFRSMFFVAMMCCLAFGVLSWIVARLLRQLRSRALALVLEKRFPKLDDRLITAVELAENGDGDEAPLASAMKRQTLKDAAATAQSLDVAAVFDRRPLNRALFAAVLLTVSIAGFSIANASAVGRWFHAYVLGDEHYWDPFRQSALEVAIVSQPGERLQKLTTEETYKHPRGADLVVRVDVPDGKLVPEQVTLHYRTHGETGSGRGRVTMTQIGDRTFRHAMTKAVDDHQLWVVGGDYTNRLPYRIEVVDPPAIDRVSLTCDYPDYTGMDAFADQRVPVQGSQVSLPIGTVVVLRADVNKPLVGLRLRCPAFDLFLSRDDGAEDSPSAVRRPWSVARNSTVNLLTTDSGRRTTDTADRRVPLAATLASGWLNDDGDSFELPLVVSPDVSAALASVGEVMNPPLPIPTDVPLQFELFDADGIQSSEPIRLTINGIVDLPPVVETRLKGIGRSITRLASIPLEGTLTDDYGVAFARFGYRVDDLPDYEFIGMAEPPTGQKAFTIGSGEQPAVERFAVRPLELSLGQKLGLSVFAGDADDVTGPHESHGEVYSFTVVSAEDLLAEVYDKELNLRQRFEQIMAEVRETREDIAAQREQSVRARTLRESAVPGSSSAEDGGPAPTSHNGQQATDDDLGKITAALDAAADRRLNAIRKNHTETRSIEELFGDIRAELVNNRVDTATMLERIDAGIVTPLHQINEFDYPEVDRNLALFKLVNEEGRDATGDIDRTLAALDVMLDRMNAVLREMRRRETFNELVKRLQSILEKQAEIRDETNKARMRSLIEGQFKFGDSE